MLWHVPDRCLCARLCPHARGQVERLRQAAAGIKSEAMHFEVHTVDSFQVENNVAWTYVTDTGPAMRPTPTGELSSRRKKEPPAGKSL